ncbi:ATP-dependent nuclease [Sphaerotilaceae bacterium SBD11-9]
MRLAEVVIKNFCSCADITVPLSGFNPIVGYNNSGKSNILRAISWMLRKSVLPGEVFFDLNSAVTVEGVIENVNLQLLPQNQQQAVAPFLSGTSLRFRRRQNLPSCPVGHLKIDVFDYQTNSWVDNPAGLDNAIAVLFPEPLHIEAMEDASEDVAKFGAKNTIGLLLKQVLNRINANNAGAIAAMRAALAQVSGYLNGQNRMAELATFETDATTAISGFFPGLSLYLNFTPPEIEDLFKSSTVKLSDVQGQPRPFTSFGHGAQRSAHMALIKLLADITAGAGGNPGGTVVLLIDEPELYLHPQAIELLRESLLQLSSQHFQIVFSTHSPLLIGRAHALQALMIYKDHANRTVARQRLSSAAAAFAAHPHHAEAAFSIQSATHLLFSEKVLLVEGKTEQMLIPNIYQVVRGNSFAHDKGCIVSGSSSNALLPMMNILRSVGFSPKALADLDFVFRVAPGTGLVDAGTAPFITCKNWFAANAGAHSFFVDANGWPTKSGPNGARSSCSAAEAFELMAAALPVEVDQVVQPLRSQDIWVWPSGAIEVHLGIGKTDTDRVNFINAANLGGNLNHAARPQDLIDFANWV